MTAPDGGSLDELQAIYKQAHAAIDEGRLAEAAALFARLLEADPDNESFLYMKGLAHKYRREWAESLRDNLRALSVAEERNEGAEWNAAIAATALGDWSQARALWSRCDIPLPEGEGPIEDDFGIACVRLNPWSEAETLYARRIDPARAVLLNVPLPKSGYRWGDVVLNDGAPTGEREFDEGTVPVFNALQLLHQSEFQTFVAFVGAQTEADIDALLELQLPGLGEVEDWTGNLRHYCLRCSYGAPHRHASSQDGDGPPEASNDDLGESWEPERNLGIAAQSRQTVDKLLALWVKGGRGRRVDSVELPHHPLSGPEDGSVWWRSLDEEDEGEAPA